MKKSKLLSSRIYLYMTEFFAGMSVMAGSWAQAVCWLRISARPR